METSFVRKGCFSLLYKSDMKFIEDMHGEGTPAAERSLSKRQIQNIVLETIRGKRTGIRNNVEFTNVFS